MCRHELRGGAHAVALGEHRAQRLDLHLAEAGKGGQVAAERLRVGCVAPHTFGVTVVVVADVHRELVHALGHRAGEAMDGGFLAEGGLQVEPGELRGVERAQPLPNGQRSRERLLHGDLLVQREADQQRHRVGREQRVGLVGVSEVQAVGHWAHRIGDSFKPVEPRTAPPPCRGRPACARPPRRPRLAAAARDGAAGAP